jgi:predicted GIY-YIG superfamily endonuclease
MAVLVTAIHASGGCATIRNGQEYPMQGGLVYIMTNRANGTLYIGVTSDLVRRIWEHREGVAAGFTKRYGLKRLVWVDRHEDRDPAREDHEALAAGLEGAAHPGRQSDMG